jgi:hypothetical protein
MPERESAFEGKTEDSWAFSRFTGQWAAERWVEHLSGVENTKREWDGWRGLETIFMDFRIFA